MTAGCPSGKVRYATERVAQIALTSTRARAALSIGRRADSRRETRVYRCPLCHGWHLTSSRKGGGADLTTAKP